MEKIPEKQSHPRSVIIKKSMPLQVPLMTFDFSLLSKYFINSQDAQSINSYTERKTLDNVEAFKKDNMATMAKLAGFGMLIFFACLGAYIVMQAGGKIPQQPVAAVQTIQAIGMLPWCKYGKKDRKRSI